jgi:hypothetical protein
MTLRQVGRIKPTGLHYIFNYIHLTVLC